MNQRTVISSKPPSPSDWRWLSKQSINVDDHDQMALLSACVGAVSGFMKHHAWVAATLMMGCVPAWAFPNEPDGFRGVLWGAPFSEHKEKFIERSRQEDSIAYVRKDDRMQIGEAKLSVIRYTFYKGRFSDVSLQTNGYKNKTALVRALETQFGPGNRLNRDIDNLHWRGKKANIILSCTGVDVECTVVMLSTAMFEEERVDRKAAKPEK